MSFYSNFIFLCNSVQKSPSRVVLDIGLKKSAVTRWKSGGNPTDATAKKIADYFDIPVFAITGEKTDDLISEKNRIYQTMIERGKTLKQLSDESGIPQKTIRSFGFLEKTEGMRDCLEEVAKALNVEPAYLLGKVSRKDDCGLYEYTHLTDKQWELFNYDPYSVYGYWENVDLDDSIDLNEKKEKKFQEKKELAPEGEHMGLPHGAEPIDFSGYRKIPIMGRISAGLPIYAEQNIEGYTMTDLNSGAEYFALRVFGDSMNAARIQERDIVIVRRQEEVENGEIAVVMVGDDDATIKRFYSSGDAVTLMPQSTNQKHQPQFYDLRKTKIQVLGKVMKVEFSV